MKKISTLLLSSLFSLSLFAYDGTALRIFTANSNMNLKVEIDGQRVMMQGNSIILNNLCEGYHNVRVYREKKSNDGFSFGQRDEIIFSTSVYLSSNYHSEVIISKTGRGRVDSYRLDPDDDCTTTANCRN